MRKAIEVHGVTYTAAGRPILNDVSMEVGEGEFVGVIGPNGSGKSTLLKNIYKVLSPAKGKILLYGQDIQKLTNRQAASRLAVVAQENSANFDFTVEEVVSMGRYPSKKMLDTLDEQDSAIIQQVIRSVGIEAFAKHSFLHLSGGEKQRALIARAMAQQTEIIVLDEPTNHLDIGSQIHTLRMLKSSGKTILAALHDLGTASRCCDRIYVMQEGAILCSGKPKDIITKPLIEALYHIQADIFDHNEKLFIDFY
ncbi:ABC transporter ATP-binding protein [Oscillospiraceae bacterium MB08-C2-2]|nr:ABC transporter ATP-binding protein [Oscillospiraceae bacterium MB08-C2-2]